MTKKELEKQKGELLELIEEISEEFFNDGKAKTLHGVGDGYQS